MKAKGFVSGLLIGAISTLSISIFAEDILYVSNNSYPIFVDGNEKDIDSLNVNGSTYLGLQATADALNASVKFNGENIEITNKKTEKLPDFSVPEISSKIEPTKKEDVKFIEYNGYQSIIYNNNTYIDCEYIKEKNCSWNLSKTTNKLFIHLINPKNKNKKVITSTKINEDFIIYENYVYFNINFLNEILK